MNTLPTCPHCGLPIQQEMVTSPPMPLMPNANCANPFQIRWPLTNVAAGCPPIMLYNFTVNQ
jgi:hypothetical protein